MADRRRTFGPVVLAGLASAALTAVAGTRPWVTPGIPDGDRAAGFVLSRHEVTQLQEAPLAAALALVVLACWGVILVTRGRFRRAVAGLLVLAAVGYLATALTAPWRMQDPLADRIRALAGSDVAAVSLTAWWWAAAAAGALGVLTAAAAAVLAPHWPEMGTRYDAPRGASTRPGTDAPDARGTGAESNLDLWKALDEGRDPTA